MFVVYESYTGETELFFFHSPRENAIMLSTSQSFSAENFQACYVEDINLNVVNLCTSEYAFMWAILIQDVDYDYFILKIDDWKQFHEYLAENMELICAVCKIKAANQVMPLSKTKE